MGMEGEWCGDTLGSGGEVERRSGKLEEWKGREVKDRELDKGLGPNMLNKVGIIVD